VQIQGGGFLHEAYFCDVLQVLNALIKRKRSSIQLWSGVAAPAPPSDRRETPTDGEDFKMREELVMKNWEELACELGLHEFSDNRRLSWSGGTLLLMLRCFC